VSVSALHAHVGGCALLVECCIGNLLQLRRRCTLPSVSHHIDVWDTSTPAYPMAHCLLPREPWPPSPCSSSRLFNVLALASWPSPCPRRTILGFAKTSLEIVERKIAHLVLETVQIHGVCIEARLLWLITYVCVCAGVAVAASKATDCGLGSRPPGVPNEFLQKLKRLVRFVRFQSKIDIVQCHQSTAHNTIRI
jgi:hypothetical protein